MNFWSVYESEKAKPEFGSDKLYITSRDRIHLSLSTVEQYAFSLEMDHAVIRQYSEAEKYVIASNITHDILISIYDVNTTLSVLLRASELPGKEAMQRVIGEIRKLRKPNMEMRLIGLQNSEADLLVVADDLHAALKPSLMEVDVFGKELRNIVFDLKLGMTFNLLLLNRIYRPGELVNALGVEEFNKKKSELKFV
jgi:hypothetical protein